jgi:hypothetical protein
MTNEMKQNIREKLAQSRRILQKVTDPDSAESLRKYVEELERRMLHAMSEGRTKRVEGKFD